MPPSAMKKRSANVMFADNNNNNQLGHHGSAHRRHYADDTTVDEISLSSRSSDDSSDGSSREFCEDSSTGSGTRTAGSISKRTAASAAHTAGSATNNWLDDNVTASKSSSVVIVLVIVTAIALGAGVYVVSKNRDEDEFHSKFNDVSDEIFQVVQERTRSYTSSLHRISLTMTDKAATTGEGAEWPFFTMTNLDMFAEDLLVEEDDSLLTYAPLVSQEYRAGWETYSVQHQSLVTAEVAPEDPHLPVPPRPNISDSIYRYVLDDTTAVDELETAMGPFSPAWQVFPVPSGDNITVVNLNLLSDDTFARLAEATELTRTSVMSELEEPQELLGIPIYHNRGYQPGPDENPQRLVVQPIFADFQQDANIVGHLVGTKPWLSVFSGIIQEESDDEYVEIHCVVKDSCTGRNYTYWINGMDTVFAGIGDLHETDLDSNNMERSSVLASYTLDLEGLSTTHDQEESWDHCFVELSVYPTVAMEANYASNAAVGYLLLIVFLCVVLVMAFTVHNKAMDERQKLLQNKTQRSNAIIASLFPEQIRAKLFADDGEVKEDGLSMINSGAQKSMDSLLKRTNSKSSLGVLGFDDDAFEQKQIADLFPSCTVMFMDICGFTAWSSTRDPAQVFNLLETVFRGFDEIARRRRVFKVETIGDCYLAVCGLPEPRRDHGITMARFARDCLEKFHEVTRMLEVTLGPDTGDLGLRLGMHSGPVTAGVLRGERGRFQLFGDTVNTCSRLETTGERDRIHISKETAELVRSAGKGMWLKPRREIVQAKGKGALETFWLMPKSCVRSSVTNSTGSQLGTSMMTPDERVRVANGDSSVSFGSETPIARKEQSEAKLDRLIYWVSESLLSSLRQVVARREASSKPVRRGPARESVRELEQEMSKNKIVLGEVREVITLPKFDPEAYANQRDPKTIDLGPNVENQLREYVAVVASLYQANPFHSFHHASHVTMSMMKLMSRIVAPDNVLRDVEDPETSNVAADLHDYTYGITSDPLTQFAVLFSAIIHDADHRGISNADLCKENELLAKIFDKKSVAEQNSIDLAWQALMDPDFQDLRDCIYTDATELRRFRQLVVNTVLATDIFDKELSALRKRRWDKAFEISDKDATLEDVHRKATIVLEHLIQASDVSHTMQHWQVYLKWNEHFFEEQYTAFLQGRNTGKDPSEGWYKGEIWFFDNYVIPLAKKLKNCGVFGVSSDEYLNYALMNREEWEKKGEEVVAQYVEKYGQKMEKQGSDSTNSVESLSVASTAPSCVSDDQCGHASHKKPSSFHHPSRFSSKNLQTSMTSTMTTSIRSIANSTEV